ncbi:ATP-dependent Clp protease proteolytic subunit [Christensenella minuta]|nr:ATP-dependent Clp protease proteolytic subunit [Christensenella minuta]
MIASGPRSATRTICSREIIPPVANPRTRAPLPVPSIDTLKSSVILCAGKSDITPAGMVMIHNVSVAADGDYRDMDAASEMLKQANDSVAAAYQLKTGKSRAEILRAMDSETWMSSAEAVRFGIVDGIAGSMRDQPQLAAANSPLMPKAMIEKARTLIPKGYNVSNPAEKPDFYMREKAQQQLNILKMEELNK